MPEIKSDVLITGARGGGGGGGKDCRHYRSACGAGEGLGPYLQSREMAPVSLDELLPVERPFFG